MKWWFNYTCNGYGESPLVKKEAVVVRAIGNVVKRKEVGANERVGIGTIAKGKSKAEEVIRDATYNGVNNVGEHYVHGVLCPDRAGTEHGKAELHYEDEVRRKEEVNGVDGGRDTVFP